MKRNKQSLASQGPGKKIVVIGGGTGTYTILSGLKKYPELDLSVIVSMADSGGSNRVIRDEFGLLPTSDLRQCILALSSDNTDEILRKLFNYRFTHGTGISGMTYGNLFMAALTDILGSQKEAIEETSKILSVRGNILPVTYENSNLVATYDNGVQVLGEHFIDEPSRKTIYHKITNLEIFPAVKANSDALKAIREADLIVLGPGDLFTSVICNIVVNGVARAIKNSSAKKLFVMNIMTRFGQTDGYKASDHINEVEKYLGAGSLDYCLINKNNISKEAVKWYKSHDAAQVEDDLGNKKGLKIIRRNVVSSKFFQKSKSDKLTRSFIRHDSDKLAKAVVDII
ncbi:MAG TPA: gluconeogenesis factor YvcK family protein [Patescibacteria group bacterium]|nr:gluconeogenesis factor YvcK family protein [Patescibacteria group bacterium]